MYRDNQTILRTIAYNLPPWSRVTKVNADGTPEVSGVCHEILFALLKSINVKPILLHQKDNISGMVLKNGSWVGVINSLNTSVADISAGPLAISYTRAQVASFTHAYASTYTVILGSSSPPTMTNIAGIVTVFHKEVWLSLLVTGAVLLFVSSLQVTKNAAQVRLTFSKKSEFYQLIFSYISALFFEGTPRSPKGERARVLFGMWWMMMVLLGNAFCGLFRASMMAKREGEKVRSLDHLASLAFRITPMVLKNSAYEQYFRGGGSETHKTILNAIYTRNGDHPSDTLFGAENLRLLSRGEAVIIHEKYMVMDKVVSLCSGLGFGNFYMAKELIYPHYFAFAIRQDFDPLLLQKLNDRVLWFVEAGIPQMLLGKEDLKYTSCVSRLIQEDSWTTLGMEDIRMIFVSVLVCCGAAATAQLVEMAVGRVFVRNWRFSPTDPVTITMD